MLLVTAPRAVNAAEFVLREDAAPAVGAILGVARPLPDGTQLSARISEDRILVTAGSDEAPVLRITLVPAAVAPPDAPRAAGSALLATPGPAPGPLVDAVRERLRGAGRDIPWTPVSLWSGPSGDLAAVAHLLDRGETLRAEAALAALSPSTSPERVLAAALQLRLGHPDRADALLGDLAPVVPANRALVAALRGEAPTGMGCDAVQVAQALTFVGRSAEGLAAARAIRRADPRCIAAWLVELDAARGADGADTDATAAEALKAHPDDPRIVQAAASVWEQTQPLRAYRALEPLVRDGRLPPEALAGPLGKDDGTIERLLPEFEEHLAANPRDPIAAYVAGTALHYQSAFERSNELLLPLTARWPDDQRLQSTIAMNDFNLGRPREALERLDRIAQSPVVDREVFYDRAEVLRDTNPAAALADLERSLALATTSPDRGTVSTARLRALVAATRDCAATGQSPCPGPWVHPRRATAGSAPATGEPTAALTALVGVALVLGALATWARRRRAAA